MPSLFTLLYRRKKPLKGAFLLVLGLTILQASYLALLDVD